MSKEHTVSTVTFGVIAYNETECLPALLGDLLAQSYPKERIEVILVDGESTDDTLSLMEIFKRDHEKDFFAVKVLSNPRRIQPCGWNIVIRNATADAILRIDAHARLPENFVEKSVDCLNTGEDVCGGPRENVILGDSLWKRTLLDVEQSLFGSGFASYRRDSAEKKYVSSVFHGAYRREVFEKAGLFNEALIRTEDNEIHYRIRENGYRIAYDPAIRSRYQTRNSLPRMLKQKYQNGLWIGRTLYVCPGCISLFHLVPFVFVLGILFSSVLAFFGFGWLLALGSLLYGAFLLVNTLLCLVKTKNPLDPVLPPLYFLLHLSYGIGTLVGLCRGKP